MAVRCLWQARTAGYLYKAQLRHELTASLGVDWGPVHKGAAEIIGIPAELCAVVLDPTPR